MKRILTMLSLVIMGFAATSCYDDSALWESFNDLEQRVKTLETLCKEMNTNITSLQSIVNAQKNGDYIVDVSPLMEDDVEVGYEITFKEHGTVKIYHGKDGAQGIPGQDGTPGTPGQPGADGAPGAVPEIGVKQDVDGLYYWTLNGEWLLDAEGNKLPVTPKDGAQGVTPKLKVENEKWYVSYDEGKTWEEVGSAVSESQTCLFKDVKLTEESLTLTLADGSVFVLPIGERFRIVLGEFDAEAIQYGIDVEIPYTIEGAEGEVSVYVLNDGWVFKTAIVEETDLSGKLIVRQGEYYDEEVSGKIALFAVTEDGNSVSKAIRLHSGVLRPSTESTNNLYLVEASACQFEFIVTTNRDFAVKTSADWISYADTKAVEEKTLVFDVKENEGPRRKADIEVSSGDIKFIFTVAQKGFSDGFAVNISCSEIDYAPQWNINIDTLYNKSGQKIHEVLGYSSWEEVAAAAGNYEDVYNRRGEVILCAYDLYTGFALSYDEEYRDGLGFRHDSEGYLVREYGTAKQKTWWWWTMAYDDTSEYLSKEFSVYSHWYIAGSVHAGDVCSLGILLVSPYGEARIDVTINITECIDPEEGKYSNPADPGQYKFALRDTIDINAASPGFYNYEISELMKSTLGKTTYEIYRAIEDGLMTFNYVLTDGQTADGRYYMYLDADGDTVGAIVAELYWCHGLYPGDQYVNINLPYENWNGNTPLFSQAVYDAVGKTISYDYVVIYEDYELVFTHEISYIDSSPKPEGNCIIVESQDMVEAQWDTQFFITFDHEFREGDYWELSMNIKADVEAVINTELHRRPGVYLAWNTVGSPTFKSEWTSYKSSGTVYSEMVGGTTIAFDMNTYAAANRYYFDNISFKINGVEQIVNGDCEEPYERNNFLANEEPANLLLPARFMDSAGEIIYYEIDYSKYYLTGAGVEEKMVELSLEGGYYIARNVRLTGRQAMVFTRTLDRQEDLLGMHGPMAPNEIGEVGDIEISVIESGEYDVYLAESLDKFYFMSPGKHPSEAVERTEHPTFWGLMGTLNIWWERDITMEYDGTWHVAYGVCFDDDVRFRIHGNCCWEDAMTIGVSSECVSYGLNEAIPVVTAEYTLANLGTWITDFYFRYMAGSYDIYFSPEKMEMWVMNLGMKPTE